MRASGVVSCVLGLAIGLLPLGAPEHVHEREAHGHADVVVHRHVAPHDLLEPAREHDASVDEDDAPVLTLSAVYTVPTLVTLAGPARLGRFLVEPPGPQRLERTQTKFDVPIHGPPRAPSLLRGPPLSPAS